MVKKSFFILALLAFMYGTTLFAATGEGFFEGGDILYTKPVRSVLFTHQVHVNQKKISCDQCHSGLFDMEALKAEKKKDFNMESLYQGRYCGACHNGKKAFASDSQCARCHLRVKELEKEEVAAARPRAIPSYKTSVSLGAGDTAVRFNHETHTESSRCTVCHPGLFKIKKGANRLTIADHGKPKYCFACHDGKKSFSWNDCSRCHTKIAAPQAVSNFGKGEKAVSFTHKSHSERLKCDRCHPGLFPFQKGATQVTFASHASGTACFSCHKKSGTAFYEECSGCHKDRKKKAAPQGPGPLTYTMEGAGPVQFLHESHGSFACNECHLKSFAMKKGDSKMTMAEMYQGKSCGLCHDGKKAFQSMQCTGCHKNN